MHAFIALLKRFHSDERGIFAVIFGVMALVLVALAGAAVDYTSMETARTRAQIALDSAALGLGPKIYDDDVTEEDLIADAQAVVREQLANVPQVTVNVTAAEINDEAGTLRLTGDVTVPMAFVQLVGIQTLTAGIVSEATKGSINLEVALAIDITKSMEDTEEMDQITALETASAALIDIVVKEDNDGPTYTKMAVIPWSMGVNLGALANAVRGEPITSYTSITAASWTSSSKNITAATKANPAVITSNGHGFATNDRVWISGVSGMTQLNSKIYCVVKVDNNKFQLKATSSGGDVCGSLVSSSNYSNFNTNQTGTAKKCVVNTCKIRVTSDGHGMDNDDSVYISNVGGMTQLNNKGWQVESVASNTFVIKDVIAPTSYGTYSSGGRVYCANNVPDERPCHYYRYVTADGSTVRTPVITNCVTERETDRYTNEIPSEVWLGRHYPDGNSLNNCITNEILPLTSVKEDVLDAVKDLTPAGSTSGHIGLAWAWYLLSHDFGADLFPADSESIPAKPDADDAEPVMKVIVLMTDGLFNTNYCNGVVAKNADSVAGNSQQRSNCNGVNSTEQGAELCTKIDEDTENNIIIYTVAFALQEIADEEDRETVRQMLADCATDDGGAYDVTDGEGLNRAFREIARNITDLRLSL